MALNPLGPHVEPGAGAEAIAGLLCPTCRQRLDPDSLICPGGHRFRREGGVLVLLGEAFEPTLRAFVAAVAAWRQERRCRAVDPAMYPELPAAGAKAGDVEWRMRLYDLQIIERLLRGRGRQRILDVGAYNCWLSHRLARQGHDVTAVDYFGDDVDGLGAKRRYPSGEWLAIQLDLADLSILNRRYDVVILNRCVQFAPDPAAFLGEARRRVAPGGLLALTGLGFFRDPRRKADAVDRARRQFRERFGVDLFLRPTRGYLDFADRERFRREGLVLRPYPQLRMSNALASLWPARPKQCFGIHRAGS